MTWPRPGLKLAGAFLCVCAVKKNPKRGGLGTIHAWGLRQLSSRLRGRGSCLAGQQTIQRPSSPQGFSIKVTLGAPVGIPMLAGAFLCGSLAMLASIAPASSAALAASFAQQKIFQHELSIAGSKRLAANQAG